MQKRNELVITRVFDAPRELVFKAWSETVALTKWWGPKGADIEVKKLDFRPGGIFQYCMRMPNGGEMWGVFAYREIVVPEKIVFVNAFCDADGNIVRAPFMANWPLEILNTLTLTENGGKTTLVLSGAPINATEEEYNMFKANMEGMGKGFVGTFDKLELYIKSQFDLRKQFKTNNMSRVTTYLNFKNETEEAFKFYKSVFGTEFQGQGIVRFSEAPPHEGMPPLSDDDKKLILHIELPILGGHILMGTDAPESFGFNLNFGNNVHINLEPDSREETKRLFDSLSAGGQVTMPLQDMFFGSYYGSFTDKFGINWMVNHTEQK